MINIISVILFLFSSLGALGAESIIISDPWVRAVPSVSSVTAVYMVIENRGDEDDKLIGVKSSASEYSEIHTTVIDENNVASMIIVDYLPIPSGEIVTLKPGGSHVMLKGLHSPVKAGDKVELDLQFEKSGTIRIEAEIREDSLK